MNLKNKKPVFVPREHWDEIEKLSKASLMDIVWDYAVQIAGDDSAMDELRKRRDLIVMYRNRKDDEPCHTPEDTTCPSCGLGGNTW